MSDKRASALSPPEFFLLCQWGNRLLQAFEEMPYLVGSCERGATYRDVDVRMMLDKKEFKRMVGKGGVRLITLNMAISLWGRQVTGLPIDFQFQGPDEWAKHHDETRNPIGVSPHLRWPETETTSSRRAASPLPDTETPTSLPKLREG